MNKIVSHRSTKHTQMWMRKSGNYFRFSSTKQIVYYYFRNGTNLVFFKTQNFSKVQYCRKRQFRLEFQFVKNINFKDFIESVLLINSLTQSNELYTGDISDGYRNNSLKHNYDKKWTTKMDYIRQQSNTHWVSKIGNIRKIRVNTSIINL